MIVAQPALGAVRQIGWWALGRRRRYRVDGASMEPTLHHGEFVLVDPGLYPVPGELALAHHPGRSDVTVVKRVAAIDGDGRYVLASDNTGVGTDSRHFGPVPAEAIVGRVTLILDRPGSPLGPPRTAASRARWSVARWLRR